VCGTGTQRQEHLKHFKQQQAATGSKTQQKVKLHARAREGVEVQHGLRTSREVQSSHTRTKGDGKGAAAARAQGGEATGRSAQEGGKQ